MKRSGFSVWVGRYLLGFLISVFFLAPIQADPPSPLEPGSICMEQLRRLSCDQLLEIFLRSDMGKPLEGAAKGRVLVLTDKHLRRLRAGVFNTFWKGKSADSDGHLVNRWIGGHQWIDTHYTIGSSWMDDRPAVIVEYAPGTALFANFRDEIREIAPGLYLALLFERCPAPKLRGIIALQLECSVKTQSLDQVLPGK